MRKWLLGMVLLGGMAEAQIVLDFQTPEAKTHQLTQQVLSKSQYLRNTLREFSEGLKWPRKITVVFLECKKANAFYDPKKLQIQMCYELIDEYLELENQSKNTEKGMLSAVLFTLLHELSHALIDQFKLPATGREEDAADQFATLALLNLKDDDALLSGLAQFAREAATETEAPSDGFADAHALSAQRLYNLVCLMYGSNKNQHQDLLKQFKIPSNRVALCPEEFQDALYAWNTLLKPHQRNPKKALL